MLKVFFVIFLSLFQVAKAFEVSIIATVNDGVITSFDLNERIKISKISNPENFKNVPDSEIKKAFLERLVQETLLFKMASDNNFQISEEEIDESMKFVALENSNLKGKNLEKLLGESGYKSFRNQIKGEIIFNAILGSYLKDKLNFSEEEVEKFANSHNFENNKKITKTEARRMLTSMKMTEVQQSVIKNLYENANIDYK